MITSMYSVCILSSKLYIITCNVAPYKVLTNRSAQFLLILYTESGFKNSKFATLCAIVGLIGLSNPEFN
jgi:hypothetical protein